MDPDFSLACHNNGNVYLVRWTACLLYRRRLAYPKRRNFPHETIFDFPFDPRTAFSLCGCGMVNVSSDAQVFAIAFDTCNTVLHYASLRYFSVSQEDLAYLHALFEQYGGYFPCV